ncbi:class I SAM-dependent methyltransferase [Actinophytocola sp.]|uniref:class I SAM-dependent methyltransferase n=1 Tax=Actinophytocola sp. TaxID=1872138 RepID=UPI00389A0F3C
MTTVEHALGQLWEDIYDPITREVVATLPLDRTWRCLELGAGLGSMSYWLSEKAATVVAVDLDTSGIDPGRAPNLTVREQDVTTARFEPESFDLILARATFEHLPDPEAVLRRAVEWLAPGGWLVVEDFYYLPGEHAPTEAARAVLGAYLAGWRAQGADMHWGRRLPSTFARAGLSSVEVRVTPLGPGQHPLGNELIRERMRLQGGRLVDSGLVRAEDLDAFVAGLDDPTARDVATLLFSVRGRRAR